MKCSLGARLPPGCLLCAHACLRCTPACLLTFPPCCRLFAYGVGIHLISGQPQRRSRDINPEDDHLSFQVRSCHSRLHHLHLSYLRLGSTPLSQLQLAVMLLPAGVGLNSAVRC